MLDIKMNDENDIMNVSFRQSVILEIEGDKNSIRKESARRRYEVYKDNTKKLVYEQLKTEYGSETLEAIESRVTNISFLRKIISKKSLVYKEGVTREVREQYQEDFDNLSDLLNINQVAKKANRFVELFKNCAKVTLPYKDKVKDKYYLKSNVLRPDMYDVIVDSEDDEVARCFITSYFTSDEMTYPKNSGDEKKHDEVSMGCGGKHGGSQEIVNNPDSFNTERKEFVWWSGSYHFTTDASGAIINRGDGSIDNPIKRIPATFYGKDRDGQFWAVGGEDLVDGAIHINLSLTDIYYIMKYQGMGLLYITGTGVSKNHKIGPREVIRIEQKEGEPTPQIGFATSNPPIDMYVNAVKEYLYCLLSTNNLEPQSASGGLNASNVTSGIHEVIKKSENTEDIEEQRELYRDNERDEWDVIFKWHDLYSSKKLLREDFAKIKKIPFDEKVTVKYSNPQPFISEKEKLEIIDKRMEIGLDRRIDSIIRDNPDLTEKEAKERLLVILKERLDEAKEEMDNFVNNGKDNKNGNIKNDIQDKSPLDRNKK